MVSAVCAKNIEELLPNARAHHRHADTVPSQGELQRSPTSSDGDRVAAGMLGDDIAQARKYLPIGDEDAVDLGGITEQVDDKSTYLGHHLFVTRVQVNRLRQFPKNASLQQRPLLAD
eukprot:scaffold4611_cov253-Pinguiococcus_pyrenoidosus.AAC.2